MIDKILEDREKRFNKVIELLDKYGFPVLCAKINCPGPHKNTEETKLVFSILTCCIDSSFKDYELYSEIFSGADGPSFMAVLKIDNIRAKRAAVKIEESTSLGRIFDIDIYTDGGRPVDRNEIGKKPRTCIICGDDARTCMRTGKHSIDEVIAAFKSIINEGINSGYINGEKHENRIL